MRKLVPILLLGGLTACSPTQEQAWLSWFHRDPEAATEFAANDCGELCTNDTNHNGIVEPDVGSGGSGGGTSSASSDSSGDSTFTDEAPSGGPLGGACSQWSGLALAVGFTADEWPTVSRIMYAESRCDPNAYNSQSHFGGHATGLMQIIDPTWPNAVSECQGGLFNPTVNLRCAYYLKSHYGWGQWSTY